MQSIELTALRTMDIVERDTPQIVRDDDVLLKIEKVGVCGSDVHYYETGKIGSQVVSYPFRVGHECSATVAEVGRGVTHVKVGDRVAVEPAISCGTCDQCLAGRENTCRKLVFLGCPGQIEGCLSDYLVMPEECCFVVPDHVSLDHAVLCEPLSIGIYAVKQSGVNADSRIAVLGAGPIGLSVLTAAHDLGIRSVSMTDKIDARISIAQQAGAVWVGNPDKDDVVSDIVRIEPGGMDAVFECAGEQSTIDEAVELVKPGGRIMLVGIPREDRISFPIDKLRRKEITVVNVRRQNKCVQPAIDMIAAGRVSVDYMITHQFDAVDVVEAFEMVANYRDGVIKAMINF